MNKIALLAHFLVDDAARPMLADVCTLLSKSAKIPAMADGRTPAQVWEEKFSVIAATANAYAKNYSNPFDENTWKELADIDPSKGQFDDGKDFSSLWTKMKNQHDTLVTNLNQSGRNEADEILDETAMQFCKASGRMLNLPLFYCYMLWKGRDLKYATNALPSSVGMSTGLSASSSSAGEKGHKGEEGDTKPIKRTTRGEKNAAAAGRAFSESLAPLLALSDEPAVEKELLKKKVESEVEKNYAAVSLIKPREKLERGSYIRETIDSPAYDRFTAE